MAVLASWGPSQCGLVYSHDDCFAQLLRKAIIVRLQVGVRDALLNCVGPPFGGADAKKNSHAPVRVPQVTYTLLFPSVRVA